MQRKHEAIQLRFGQRISAFLLDGILRGHHEKWIRQRACLAGDRDLAFLHGFEQRGLCLRRSAVDFIGQNEIREDWPRLVFVFQPSLTILKNFGANDVRRHQVRRELDAFET